MAKDKGPTNREEAAKQVRLAHAECIRWNLERDRARGLVNQAGRAMQEHRREMALKASQLTKDDDEWRALVQRDGELSSALGEAEWCVRYVESKRESAQDALITARARYYEISERQDGRDANALLRIEQDRVTREFHARNMVREIYAPLKQGAESRDGKAIGTLQWLKDHWRWRDGKAVVEKYGEQFKSLAWAGDAQARPSDRELAKQLVDLALNGDI